MYRACSNIWEDLDTRRQHGKMVLMDRIVNHLVVITASIIRQPVGASRRGHNQISCVILQCRCLQICFLPIRKRLWNSLPTETLTAQSLEPFKTHELVPVNTDVLTSFRCKGLHTSCHVPVNSYCASMLQRSPAHHW